MGGCGGGGGGGIGVLPGITGGGGNNPNGGRIGGRRFPIIGIGGAPINGGGGGINPGGGGIPDWPIPVNIFGGIGGGLKISLIFNSKKTVLQEYLQIFDVAYHLEIADSEQPINALLLFRVFLL